MPEENKNLEDRNKKNKSWIIWLCLFIITWIILELMALIPSTTGNILIFGPIIVGFSILTSILIPLGIILFFIKWPKSRNTKIITFLILLPLIFRAFPGTYFGSIIVYIPINGLMGLQAEIEERKIIRTGNPEKCFEIGEGLIWEFLYSFPLNLDGMGRTPWAYDLECISHFAIAKNDATVCKLILNQPTNAPQYFTDDCFFKVAPVLKDKTICENIHDSGEKSKCLKSVDLEIKATENPILKECIQMSGEFEKDICIRNLAVEKKDKEFCKYLIYEGHREPCEMDVRILTEKIFTPCRKFVTLKIPTTGSELVFHGPYNLEWEKEDCIKELKKTEGETADWKTYSFNVQELKEIEGLTQEKQKEVEEKIIERKLENCSFEIKYPPDWTSYTWPLHGVIVPEGLFIEEDAQTHNGCSFQMSFYGDPEKEKYCFPTSFSNGASNTEKCNKIFNQMLSTFRFLD